jgi:hypothetical protein
MKLFSLPILVVFLFASCTTIRVIKKMNKEEATYETWKNSEDKTVVFIPMVHAAKAAFYADVKRVVTEHKQQGYIVFYEGLKKSEDHELSFDTSRYRRYVHFAAMQSFDSGSIRQLVYLLKVRRMVGIIPDSTTYMSLVKTNSLTKNMVFQPPADSLGVTGSDMNTDVSLVELVREYEKKFGEIALEQIDFAIPLDKPLSPSLTLKRSRANELILDHRNKNLSDSIKKSPAKKILVIYGMAHKEGVFNELKQSDPSWKIIS